MKRFLSCNPSEIIKLTKDELFLSIKSSEGRIILSENVVVSEPFLKEITNSEIAVSFGADLILLNCVDVLNIDIKGMKKTNSMISDLKKLVSRPIGVNLEPIDDNAEMLEDRIDITKGRTINKKTLEALNNEGFDFLCITGNPGTGVTTKSIEKAIKLARSIFKGLIIAGKMHGAGTNEEIYDKNIIKKFIDAGADVIMIPSPCTVPGSSIEVCKEIVDFVKSKGKLTMGAIGTSQETSDIDTIKQIGLYNKMVGFDIHHIGDAGSGGIAPYNNIFELSKSVRGIRHTLKMICTSINR